MLKSFCNPLRLFSRKSSNRLSVILSRSIGCLSQRRGISTLHSSLTRNFHSTTIKYQVDNPNTQYNKPENVLSKYCIDLTEKALQNKVDPVIGRDEEIRRTIQILSRRTKSNPVLIGEAGVGKTAIVEGLAQRIIKGEVPDSIKNKKVLTLDLPLLVAGCAMRGEFEQRIKQVITEVEKQSGKIILFIDEIHTLIGAGASGNSMDASNILKPSLARGSLHCIGATTTQEYKKYIEKDPALARRFQQLMVHEPDTQNTLAILRGLKEKYEVHHGVQISDSALISAVHYADRYLTGRHMPDKAIDLLDESASRLRLQQESKPESVEILDRQLVTKKIEFEALKKETDEESIERQNELKNEIDILQTKLDELNQKWESEKSALNNVKKIKESLENSKNELEKAQRTFDLSKASELKYGKIPQLEKELADNILKANTNMLSPKVTDRDISEVISRVTGIPLSALLTTEKEQLTNLEELLKHRVIGQDDAIKSVSECVRVSRAGLRDPKKPLGVFLFMGPTGVGKTELAKALTEILFKNENAMSRFDMSEFMEKFNVSKLIGSPPGYVGYEEGGKLTELVLRKPYQILLFDEIEKAHKDVCNILLQVFDDGRLTDSQGTVVDFKNTIIILTSNLGSNLFYEGSMNKNLATDIARKHFSPEFVNRLDDIILFNGLSEEQILKIVDLQLQQVNHLLKEKKISVEIPNIVKVWISNLSYNPVYGARPVRRAIQTHILSPLSKLIIQGVVSENDTVVFKVYDKLTGRETDKVGENTYLELFKVDKSIIKQ